MNIYLISISVFHVHPRSGVCMIENCFVDAGKRPQVHCMNKKCT